MEKRIPLARYGVRAVLLALVSAAFLAVCALSTTPLLQYSVGQDAAFFRLVGQGMTQGLLPYRDFFDMKGPYLFLMEYLGQLVFPGRMGAFLLEWLCLFVTLLFGFKCWDAAFGEKCVPFWLSPLLLLPMGYVLSFTMTGGNLTEELSLPFLMPCLYLFLRYLNQSRIPSPENQDHPVWVGFYYGVTFGVMALIRVTNGALIGAILLTAVCNLAAWKRFRNLFANGGMFLLGILVGAMPGLIWCYFRGILPEMLSQVFLFGFRYSGESGLLQSLASMGQVRSCLALLLLPAAPLIFYRLRDWKLWLFFVSSALTVLAAALMGNGYCHYFVLALPNMVYAGYLIALGISRGSHWRRGKQVLCFLLSVFLSLGMLAFPWKLFRVRAFEEIRYGMYCARYGVEPREEYDAVQSVLAAVPQEEQKDLYVYGLDSCSAWYLQAGLLPPMKYCDWQPHYIQLVPQIGGEIESYLRSGNAKWVVTKETVEPEAIRSCLQENYKAAAQTEKMVLWEKN